MKPVGLLTGYGGENEFDISNGVRISKVCSDNLEILIGSGMEFDLNDMAGVGGFGGYQYLLPLEFVLNNQCQEGA